MIKLIFFLSLLFSHTFVNAQWWNCNSNYLPSPCYYECAGRGAGQGSPLSYCYSCPVRCWSVRAGEETGMAGKADKGSCMQELVEDTLPARLSISEQAFAKLDKKDSKLAFAFAQLAIENGASSWGPIDLKNFEGTIMRNYSSDDALAVYTNADESNSHMKINEVPPLKDTRFLVIGKLENRLGSSQQVGGKDGLIAWEVRYGLVSTDQTKDEKLDIVILILKKQSELSGVNEGISIYSVEDLR